MNSLRLTRVAGAGVLIQRGGVRIQERTVLRRAGRGTLESRYAIRHHKD